MLALGSHSHGAVGDVQGDQVGSFLTEPEEAEVGTGLLALHGGALAGPGLGVVLMGAGLAFFHFGNHVTGVVQHVRAPVAGVCPGFHFLGEVHQLVAFHIVAAQGVGVFLALAVEDGYREAFNGDVAGVGGLPAAGHLGAVGGAVAVGVPRDHARLVFLDVLEVYAQVFPGMDTVLQAGFLGPVAAVHEAVVGPLRVVVFGHEVNLIVVLAQVPVGFGHGLPGLGGVGLQHILSQFQESALLGVGPRVQPVGGGTDQVDVAALGGQGQVVLGLPVGPLDPAELQLRVDLFGQQLIDLGQHFVGPVGGLVAGDQVHDLYVLRGVNGTLCHGRDDAEQHRQGQENGNQFLHGENPPYYFSRAAALKYNS